jgi:hypothetical protein
MKWGLPASLPVPRLVGSTPLPWPSLRPAAGFVPVLPERPRPGQAPSRLLRDPVVGGLSLAVLAWLLVLGGRRGSLAGDT